MKPIKCFVGMVCVLLLLFMVLVFFNGCGSPNTWPSPDHKNDKEAAKIPKGANVNYGFAGDKIKFSGSGGIDTYGNFKGAYIIVGGSLVSSAGKIERKAEFDQEDTGDVLKPGDSGETASGYAFTRSGEILVSKTDLFDQSKVGSFENRFSVEDFGEDYYIVRLDKAKDQRLCVEVGIDRQKAEMNIRPLVGLVGTKIEYQGCVLERRADGWYNNKGKLITIPKELYAEPIELDVKLIRAASSGDSEQVLALLKQGADANARFKGFTPLLMAAQPDAPADTEKHLAVIDILISAKADINARDKSGLTPLARASLVGSLDIVKKLLAYKANPNIKSYDGLSALTLTNSEDIAKELIAAHADVNVTSDDGFNALTNACSNGNLGFVKMLIQANANVNVRDSNGLTPFMYAASGGHNDVVKELIAARADVNSRDKNGSTALMMASGKGHLQVVKTLIAAHADVNAKSNDGITSLMIAAEEGKGAVVKELIAARADVNARDKDGKTAFMWAATTANPDVLTLLKKAGAQ
jgi:ankyrin repeat protein